MMWLSLITALILLAGAGFIATYRAGYRAGWKDRDVKKIIEGIIDHE